MPKTDAGKIQPRLASSRHRLGHARLHDVRVPEELGLDQVRRECAAVERDEWLDGARAPTWTARATNSLPVPVSPVTKTVASVGAARSTSSRTKKGTLAECRGIGGAAAVLVVSCLRVIHRGVMVLLFGVVDGLKPSRIRVSPTLKGQSGAYRAAMHVASSRICSRGLRTQTPSRASDGQRGSSICLWQKCTDGKCRLGARCEDSHLAQRHHFGRSPRPVRLAVS